MGLAFKRQRTRLWIIAAAICLLLLSGGLLAGRLFYKDTTPPVIDIWYGQRQVFGTTGALAQVWVNVLGSVSDPDGKVTALAYRLNGGAPVALSQGPDERRLLEPGDFNVEIDPADLRRGENQVSIQATNRSGLTARADITLNYSPAASVLPLPYVIHWAEVKNAQSVLQIVDGKWRWDASGIRPLALGYDRFLAVGDTRWRDYQVVVPVTVHAIDTAGFHDRNSGSQASISVDLHWLGHSDVPVHCPQPHCGWDPVGDFNKFFFKKNEQDFLALKISEKERDFPTLAYTFHAGDTYTFKVSVETKPDGNLYRMKVWEASTEREPQTWQFERLAHFEDSLAGNPDHGAFALVAHYIDVTIGDITVTGLEKQP